MRGCTGISIASNDCAVPVDAARAWAVRCVGIGRIEREEGAVRLPQEAAVTAALPTCCIDPRNLPGGIDALRKCTGVGVSADCTVRVA
jgi:hypothetical protein